MDSIALNTFFDYSSIANVNSDRFGCIENTAILGFKNRIKHFSNLKRSVRNLTSILNEFLSNNKLAQGKIDPHPIQRTGFGVNIVKRYFELIGGQFDFMHEENKGTTFTFNISLNFK